MLSMSDAIRHFDSTPVARVEVRLPADRAEHPGVTDILKRYAAGGAGALQPGQRVWRLGAQRRLSEEPERHLRRLIYDQRLEPLKMSFALWNRGAVSQLIVQELGIERPVRTVGE